MKFSQKKFTSLISLIFSLFISSSCSIRSDHSFSSDKVGESKPIVLTTFTVLADMARNVAGNRLYVNSITKPGAEIHGYQPTPSDLIKASKADLIIENGLGLELWSKKFTAAAGDIETVVLSDGIQPLLIEGDVYSGKPNPHAWMSPQKAIKYVDRLQEAFSLLDPEGANQYRKNASIYKNKLIELDLDLRATLSTIPKEKRVLVTCEGAFSYLANDYGMEEAYLWPVNAESQVTPKRMVNLINVIKKNNVPTIFCESTVSSKAQMEVAKSSGAFFGGTFYVDSLSENNGPASTYIDLLRHNVRLITKGLSISEVKK